MLLSGVETLEPWSRSWLFREPRPPTKVAATIILVLPGQLRLPWQVPGGKPAARRIHRRWENFRRVLPTRDAATVMTRESPPAIRRSLELSSLTSRRA